MGSGSREYPAGHGGLGAVRGELHRGLLDRVEGLLDRGVPGPRGAAVALAFRASASRKGRYHSGFARARALGALSNLSNPVGPESTAPQKREANTAAPGQVEIRQARQKGC